MDEPNYGIVFDEELDDDFGIDQLNLEVPEPDTRCDRIMELILPFLNNLMKHPEKDTIKWPNRTEAVAAFKEQLITIQEEKHVELD